MPSLNSLPLVGRFFSQPASQAEVSQDPNQHMFSGDIALIRENIAAFTTPDVRDSKDFSPVVVAVQRIESVALEGALDSTTKDLLIRELSSLLLQGRELFCALFGDMKRMNNLVGTLHGSRIRQTD